MRSIVRAQPTLSTTQCVRTWTAPGQPIHRPRRVAAGQVENKMFRKYAADSTTVTPAVPRWSRGPSKSWPGPQILAVGMSYLDVQRSFPNSEENWPKTCAPHTLETLW